MAPERASDRLRPRRLLAIARRLAAEAASQSDPDACLRLLRAGLLRLGFRRAGIWLLEPHDPSLLRGTWGTDWDGREVDEHDLVLPIGQFVGSREIIAGQQVVLRRLERPPGRAVPAHGARPVVDATAPPNNACVALRADGQILGIISVDMLPSADPIDPRQVEALTFLADQVAVIIARYRAVSALNEALVRLAVERAEAARQAAEAAALRALDRLKSEFLATVSHELRTPLAVIYGYAQLMAARGERFTPEQIRQIGEQIVRSARVLIRLVDDLLDLGRLERRTLVVQPAWTDLTPVLQRVVADERFRPLASRLQVDLPPALPAFADADRLRQVVERLLENALRYAPEGPVCVRAGQEPEGVWIEVADAGPGIPPDEQPRVWEKFYRGAAAAGQPGLGLGLTMARALVEAHGGTIDLQSAPGQGTRVRVVLPQPPLVGAPARVNG